ncbi:NAD(P)-dependent alcohol dehydrogenase [Streptomyces sp. WELS2]|uniref:NAD(P)-dependent alcohol dehydrogenase n=1 Tax=Streptomyces sp. WELS2 TaxID=2749435 RepID=UPI0015F07D51|nr:NAD(P)-dependent alcohol dehydrogenase [Streptomyces sp. WELS2]
MLIRAAVTDAPNNMFIIREVTLDPPGPGEVLVRMTGTGVCHSDLIVRDAWYPVPFPVVLGHEGAGVVEAVGNEVGEVSPGDHVVLSFASCGSCTRCRTGAPAYCAEFLARNFACGRPDGSTSLRRGASRVNGFFFGQSSFATHVLAPRRSVVRIPADLPLPLMGPLGCGVQTGACAVLKALRCEAGSRIAVFGAGSVGCSAVMAAVVAGCSTIAVVGRNKNRLRLAEELGATHVINAASVSAAESLRAISNGTGFDYTIEATGNPGLLRAAVDVLHTRGTCGVIGAARPGSEVALEMSGLMFGRRVRGIVEGDAVPQVDIPLLAALHQKGLLPFDRLITTYPFEAINEAARDVAIGKCVKPVLLFGEGK